MTTPLPEPERPAWQRVLDLFAKHHAPAPPWRLRDELVSWLCAKEALSLARGRVAELEIDRASLIDVASFRVAQVSALEQSNKALQAKLDKALEALKKIARTDGENAYGMHGDWEFTAKRFQKIAASVLKGGE